MWPAASTLAARLLACPVGWLGKYFPPYAPQPDAPSRVSPGSSLKQHCPPEPCAQVRGPSMCSQNAEARLQTHVAAMVRRRPSGHEARSAAHGLGAPEPPICTPMAALAGRLGDVRVRSLCAAAGLRCSRPLMVRRRSVSPMGDATAFSRCIGVLRLVRGTGLSLGAARDRVQGAR